MLISPSLADTQAHLATLVPRAPMTFVRTGAGTIARAAKRVAEMAAASSRSREEAPVGGERQVTVLLDTGASGRNFISSKLASWLIECGSTTLIKSGEVGLAQQGAAIQFHEHLSFRLRFFNSNLGTFETLTLSATIIDNLRLDVILGLPTVGKYSLLPKLTHLCGCCTPLDGAAQEPGVRGVGKQPSDRSVSPNESNSQTASLPGSLTTEIDQSARAQAPSVRQPEGVPGADCELCTLQVRSDQVFGPAEL